MKKKETPPQEYSASPFLIPNNLGYPMQGAVESLTQKWMHADDVMKVLRICRRTLYNYRRAKLLVASKTRGRILFEVAAVEAMLHKRTENC